jgi:GMP reductase
MRVENEKKLDYSDVLIRPKRSTLTSRCDVDMTRTYTFLHSQRNWTGIPVMSANMDTVGTPEMYKVLLKHKMITSPARHYLKNSINTFKGKNLCMMGGLEDIDTLADNNSKWDFMGIDVANGYTISVIDAVKSLSRCRYY